MEKLVLTSFLSPTNCIIQRHTFREVGEYRSVDHGGVWASMISQRLILPLQ